jgi:hypothetical protein
LLDAASFEISERVVVGGEIEIVAGLVSALILAWGSARAEDRGQRQ